MSYFVKLLILIFSINIASPAEAQAQVQSQAPKSKQESKYEATHNPPQSSNAKPAQSLQELYQEVTNEHLRAKKNLKQREAKFSSNLEKQAKQLEQASKALVDEQSNKLKLQQKFESNAKIISELRQQLEDQTGNLGEVFGTVRQVASEISSVLESSLVESQFPGRSQIAKELAESKSLPSIKKIEQFWYLLLAEMTESAKIQTFTANVVNRDGSRNQAEVLRVGTFNLVSNGRYLKYHPDTARLIERVRQPGIRHQNSALSLQQSASGQLQIFSLDPSRGSLLDLLIQTPDLEEHIRQSGLIGMLILGLGGLGVAIAVYRWIALGITSRRVSAQVKRSSFALINNPLGRMLLVYLEAEFRQQAGYEPQEVNSQQKADGQRSDELLVLRLEELLQLEVPKLQKGLASIGLFAAIAPLLGLLGTVTGMISTFQAITLYGTGDPKLMSGGISQALVTTELGLVVAVPLLLLHAGILAKSRQIVQILEQWNARLIANKIDAHFSSENESPSKV